MSLIKKYPLEDEEQIAFINWFKSKYKDYLIFSVPNGGSRNKVEASKLKKTGLLSGIPDLIILMPNREVLFLEMKRQKGGVLSLVQKVVINLVEKLGFTVLIGYGFLDAKSKFENYLLQKVTSD